MGLKPKIEKHNKTKKKEKEGGDQCLIWLKYFLIWSNSTPLRKYFKSFHERVGLLNQNMSCYVVYHLSVKGSHLKNHHIHEIPQNWPSDFFYSLLRLYTSQSFLRLMCSEHNYRLSVSFFGLIIARIAYHAVTWTKLAVKLLKLGLKVSAQVIYQLLRAHLILTALTLPQGALHAHIKEMFWKPLKLPLKGYIDPLKMKSWVIGPSVGKAGLPNDLGSLFEMLMQSKSYEWCKLWIQKKKKKHFAVFFLQRPKRAKWQENNKPNSLDVNMNDLQKLKNHE